MNGKILQCKIVNKIISLTKETYENHQTSRLSNILKKDKGFLFPTPRVTNHHLSSHVYYKNGISSFRGNKKQLHKYAKTSFTIQLKPKPWKIAILTMYINHTHTSHSHQAIYSQHYHNIRRRLAD